MVKTATILLPNLHNNFIFFVPNHARKTGSIFVNKLYQREFGIIYIFHLSSDLGYIF